MRTPWEPKTKTKNALLPHPPPKNPKEEN